MSIRPAGQEPSAEYTKLTNALNEGKRIVYNKLEQKFEVVTRDQAKKLKPKDYITDLPALKQKVTEFIQANGITSEQKRSLEDAFDGRASKLAGRFVLFGGAVRDQAVKNLEEFRPAIEEAATGKSPRATQTAAQASGVAEAAIPGHIPPSVPQAPPKQPSAPENPPPKPQIAAEPPSAPGGPPPPPRLPGAGGPPPPLKAPPGPGKGPTGPTFSHAHRQVTTEADKQQKFQGEPNRPSFNPAHDLGKPHLIPEGDRKAYADEIERHIQELKQVFKPLQAEAEQHSADLTRLEGLNVQLTDTTRQIEVLESRIEEMTQTNRNGQPYVLYMKGAQKGTLGNPVTFECDADYEAYQQQVAALPEADQQLLKKKGLDCPPQRTISHQLEVIRTKLESWKSDRDQISREAQTLQDAVDRRAQQTNNGIPFNQWNALLQKKNEIVRGWSTIADNLRKGNAPPPEPAKPADEAHVDELLSTLPLAKRQREFVSSLPQANLGIWKSKPDQFCASLVGENGTY